MSHSAHSCLETWPCVAILAVSEGTSSVQRSSRYKPDGFTEKVKFHRAGSRSALHSLVRDNLGHFMDSKVGKYHSRPCNTPFHSMFIAGDTSDALLRSSALPYSYPPSHEALTLSLLTSVDYCFTGLSLFGRAKV